MPFNLADSIFAPRSLKRAVSVDPVVRSKRAAVVEDSDTEGESVNDSGSSTPEPVDAELEAVLAAQDAAFIKGSDEADSADESSVSSGDGATYIAELETSIAAATKLVAFLQSCLDRVRKPARRRRLVLADDDDDGL